VPLLACPAVQAEFPAKTLLDKPAVARKIQELHFFNRLLEGAKRASTAPASRKHPLFSINVKHFLVSLTSLDRLARTQYCASYQTQLLFPAVNFNPVGKSGFIEKTGKSFQVYGFFHDTK
jgi:hypothetical protein